MDGRGSAAFALVALALPIAATGCRAVNNGNLARTAPAPLRTSSTAEEVVARINRNARAIENFRATKVAVSAGMGRRLAGGAQGLMAMERPKRFRMTLLSTAGLGRSEIADLGSDGQRFWFAVAQDKTMYTGQYDRDGNVPADVPLPMQPDWIVEALGLREITPEEVAAMKVTRTRSGLLELSYPRKTADGQTYLKAILYNEAKQQVVEHQLRTANNAVLARAQIKSYQSVAAPAGGSAEVEPAPSAAVFPRQIALRWEGEGGMSLDALIDQVEINREIPAELFQEPDKRAEGYAYRSVGGEGTYARGPATVRETRPAPADGPVRIEAPVPLNDDGAMRAGGAPAEPPPYSPDLPYLPEPEAVVGARIEHAPGTIDVARPADADPSPSPAPRRVGRLFGLLR